MDVDGKMVDEGEIVLAASKGDGIGVCASWTFAEHVYPL
jgi:hypothetical protein